MFTRFAVLALALVPLAASAQPMPMRAPGGVVPATAGITVQGHGTVRYPVKSVSFIAQARGNPDEAGALAMLRGAGVDDPTLGPIGSQLYNGPQTTLRGTIHDVTRAKLDRLAKAAADYVRAHPGANVDNVNFFTTSEGCVAHEQEARTAAVADARRKAQALAALAGVTIEGVAGVYESGGCPSAEGAQPYGPQGVPIDLGTLTASVYVVDTVTFTIAQGAPGTRRRTL